MVLPVSNSCDLSSSLVEQFLTWSKENTDLEIVRNGTRALFIFADDGTMVLPVSNSCDLSSSLVEQFLTWSKENTDLEIVRNGTRALFIFADDGTMVLPVSNSCDLSSSLVEEKLKLKRTTCLVTLANVKSSSLEGKTTALNNNLF